jgi:2-polyprenyl-6-methoxyphenol hydroxylase-like FAD-dependent oxidoreductase
MSAAKPIMIVGGGLAGLTLGIGLRQRDVPVVLWEAGKYPRHRVCGEFISGQGQEVLQDLDLLDALVTAGARPAETIAVFTTRCASPPMPLPRPALCLSRFRLDELLAGRFSELGGELLLNQRWHGSPTDGVVRASGRRAHAVVDGWRWFGLKAHAQGVVLRADLEMHLSHDGYVGLCQLANCETNVCGLFRSRSTLPELAQRWREMLCGKPGSHRHERLRHAAFDDASFCSVSGLSLAPGRASDSGECRIGDALTMTPPVTGNGMSMAFESAEIALAPLREYSRNELSWPEARMRIARACDATFERRLAWAAPLQRALFQRQFSATLVLLAAYSPWLFRLLFSNTR